VAEVHRTEGPGRLTVRRIDRAYRELPQAELRVLAELIGLPMTADGLTDVIPATPQDLVRASYLAQVSYIAPGQLIGREAELAEWVRGAKSLPGL
jgi:hypothetical protein